MSKRRRSFGAEIEYNNKDINKNNIELLSLSKEICGSSQPQINPWR
jgi:hypothetical protein